MMMPQSRMLRLLGVAAVIVSLSCTALGGAATPDKFAILDGVKIHYEATGTAEPAVVFVHGWTCDGSFWRAQANAFPGHRVIVPDLPGHGRSDKPQIDYTIPFFARAVDAVMRDAKVKRAVLVGHSMGAPIVREFYRLFPEKTAALVIVDGALRPMFPKDQGERLLEQMQADYGQMARRMVDGMLTPVRDEQQREQIRATMLATPAHVAISAMRGMTDESVYRPDPIRVPVLVVLAKSPFWAADTEAFVRSLAPDVEFHMLEGVSHFLMMDKPEEFNALLRSFLAQRAPPAR